MLEFGWEFFAVGIPAIIFGGISKGGFGSGAAFVAGAILALVVPPGAALGIVLPLFMLVDAATLKPYWGKWHWPSAKGLMIGAVPGCIIAALLYAVVDADVFRLLIGVICLAFVAFQISRSLGWLTVKQIPFSNQMTINKKLKPSLTGLNFPSLDKHTRYTLHACNATNRQKTSDDKL